MPTDERQSPRAGIHRPLVLVLVGILLAGIAWTMPSCAEPPPYLSEDGKRGWKAYRRHCTLCHNQNPFLDGTTTPGGPAIAGSSKELIRLRVTSTTYPKGYKPKRDTNEMYVLPRWKPEIPYLCAYLKEVRKAK